MANPTLRELTRLALPSIVSNITVPLLGLVDLAVTGHIGSEAYISAIATGAMVFNTLYWLCGFLRMGTSGMTAQSFGRHSVRDAERALRTSTASAFAIGILMVLLQKPLLALMTTLLGTPQDALPFATEYFRIVVYGAPAVLALYAMNGWSIGMQDTRLPMGVAILQNVVNIAVSLVLVFGAGWRIEGIATGTLVAQWTGAAVAAVGIAALRKRTFREWNPTQNSSPTGEVGEPPPPPSNRRGYRLANGNPVQNSSPNGEVGRGYPEVSNSRYLRRFASVNRDIFLRTLCLVAVNLAFTAYGSRQGSMTLAVNSLLLTLYTIFSYFMDGFAYAGEAIGGRCQGAGDNLGLRRLATLLRRVGGAMALVFTALYLTLGTPLLHVLTSSPTVVDAARGYLPVAAMIPVFGFLAFVYDGLAVGITATRQMLLSTATAAAMFFGAYYALSPRFGNYALWTAFLVFLGARGVVLHLALRRRTG